MGISSSSRSISYNAEKIVLPGALKTSLKNFHVPQNVKVENLFFGINSMQLENRFELDHNQRQYTKISSQKSQLKQQKIIYFHGNAQNKLECLQLYFPIFQKLQITTLVMEYPGYGTDKRRNIQTPLMDQIRADSSIFHKFIKKQENVRDQDIFIIGRSIGTGPASYLAPRVKCKKLLLISPFGRIKEIPKQKLSERMQGLFDSVYGMLIQNQFDNLEEIKDYDGDLLVIHGEKDQVINIKHGSNLYSEYDPEWLKGHFIQLNGQGHNNLDFYVDGNLDKIEQFFKS